MKPLMECVKSSARRAERGERARRGRRCLGDDGAALVEFALILPVLMCLILGMITGGLALSKKINMTDAVREGARFGATVDIGDPDNPAQVTDWADKVKTRIVTLSGGDLSTSDLCVNLVLSTGTAGASNANCFVADPADSAGQYVVRVRGTGTADLEALFFSRTLNLEAKVVARYERTDV